MVGWHHRLDEHEFEQALGVGDGQGSLVCYSPCGHKQLDMTDHSTSKPSVSVLRKWTKDSNKVKHLFMINAENLE